MNKSGRNKPDRTKAPAPDRETEQRILDAARSVFIRRGTAGARMQEIAAEAGVNQALLHYYFRSKERLSDAVFQQLAARLFPALIQTLGADGSVDEKIDAVIALYLENLSQNPFLPGYLLSELHHHPERLPQLLAAATGSEPGKILARVFGKLGDQIEHNVRAGTMRPISVEQFVANLISLCVFPFAARPMLSMVFGMDDPAFARFIERRKTELPAFFRNALRP
jgi:AcrR family transcriptional regulator